MKKNCLYYQIQFKVFLLSICLITGSFSQEMYQFELINQMNPTRRFDDELIKYQNNRFSSHDFQITQGKIGDSLNVRLVGRWANGPCHAVDVVGSIAYFGNGGYLEIVDFSNPVNPVESGKALVPGLIQSVAVSGNYVYVANGFSGLRVIDVSSPSNPHEVGYFDTGGWAGGVAVSGNYAYVAASYNGLRVIDVSSPSNPQEVGFFDTEHSTKGVAISGSYAYVADGGAGLRVIDVSSPSNAQEVGFFDTGDRAIDVAVSGSYVYVADFYTGLHVVDVSSPSNPQEVGFFDTGARTFGVAVSGSYAYVAYCGAGLRVIDVSSPSNLQEVGFFNTGGCAIGVAISGSYAYVADDDGGLRVIDVSNPSNPQEIGFFETVHCTKGVAVSGSYAYVAYGYAGLRVIDVSSPANPQETGFFDTGGIAQGVVVRGSYAYVADYYAGLRVIDMSRPANPQEVGFFDTGGIARDIAVSGSYAYVADDDAGLRVIDVSSPSNPQEVGFFDTGGIAHSIAVSGNYAYVADWGAGLRVIDVSSPSNPQEVGFFNKGGCAVGVAVSGSYSYLADRVAGLRVIDVSSPYNPQEIGFSNTWGNAYGVAVSGSYAYVAACTAGLRVIDVSSPSNPQEVGFFDTGDEAYGVAVSGNCVYVADGGDGLYILEYLGQPPGSPSLSQPANNSNINDNTPSFLWNIPSDADGDALHFKVEIAPNSSFTNQILGSPFKSHVNPHNFSPFPPLPQGNGTCSFIVPSQLSNGYYWWRVSAWDGKQYSQPSETWKFTIDTQKPYSTDFNPAKNATNVPITTNIMLHIKDDLSGVDKSTITMKVNQGVVTPTTTGDSKDVTITYDPPSDFDYDQRISVIVTAKDLAGNEITEYYSFHTESKPQNPAYIYMTIQQHLLHEAFEVAIVVKEVENLFGISFVFNYSAQYLEYLSTEAGDFLGNNILFIPFVPSNGQLPISITKKGTQPGSSGTGVIVKIKLKENTTATSGLNLSFSITEISAVDASYNNIIFIARDTSYTTPPDITAKIEESDNIPEEFALYQNYPNPFNPITTISYALPQRSHVSLQIFDLNGRVVKTLLNAQKEAGIHSVQWDARDNSGQRVASGIYISQLSADNEVLHQKLILTK